MTRKEMLFKIKHLLDNIDGVCTNKIKADIILSEIENLGMLPPKTQKLKKHTVNYKGEIGHLETIESVYEWED